MKIGQLHPCVSNSVQQMVSGELAGEGLQIGFSRHGLPPQRAPLDTVYPLREYLNSVQGMVSGGYCEGLFPDTVCWTRLRNKTHGHTSAKVSRHHEPYRDTNWCCIYYFLPRRGHTFAKYCDTNGRCIAIVFKSTILTYFLQVLKTFLMYGNPLRYICLSGGFFPVMTSLTRAIITRFTITGLNNPGEGFPAM